MIRFINESLMNITQEEKDGQYGNYWFTSIATGMTITPKKHGKAVPGAKSIPWKIASVISEIPDFNADNIQLKVKSDNRGSNVLLKSNPDNRYDSNVYILAWPLNGIMEPIPESKEYRIRKAFVAEMDEPYTITADMDVALQGTYRKVMFMVIEPNSRLFNPDHKFHVDTISIPLTSYKFVKENGKNKTVATTMTVDIQEFGYQVSISEEDVEPVAKEDFEATKLFHVWTAEEKPRRSNNNGYRRDNRGNGNNSRGGNRRDDRGNDRFSR